MQHISQHSQHSALGSLWPAVHSVQSFKIPKLGVVQAHLHISLPSSASQVALSLELSKLSSIVGVCTHRHRNTVSNACCMTSN